MNETTETKVAVLSTDIIYMKQQLDRIMKFIEESELRFAKQKDLEEDEKIINDIQIYIEHNRRNNAQFTWFWKVIEWCGAGFWFALLSHFIK